ncbi:hypothetical protein [Haloterrigena salifodinae]|uniref:hypothetical protein n=1 Tax=Haloterrigena salifodinae TaxID=2675099 RepID=UPI000F861D51|nr:hypothetical protein [Haloterrigena salifodinae]
MEKLPDRIIMCVCGEVVELVSERLSTREHTVERPWTDGGHGITSESAPGVDRRWTDRAVDELVAQELHASGGDT